MGIRQTMNENPKLAVGVTAGLILIAIIIIVWELASSRSGAPTANFNQAFYSDDDGKTYFADEVSKIPPFPHNGKQAVKAVVFKCKDGKPFVAHLERYTEEGKKRLEETKQRSSRVAGMMMMEVKKPGQANWVRVGGDSKAWSDIMRVTCPDGSTPEPVLPGQE